MIRRNYIIRLKPNSDQRMFLVPLGDVHFNSPKCDRERVLGLVDWAVRKKKKGHIVKFIGQGDYTDTLSASERSVIITAKGGQGFHDDTKTELDKMAFRIADEFLDALAPVKNDFLGLLRGHHWMNFITKGSGYLGKNTTQYMCDVLNCDYYGVTAKLALEFPPGKEKIKILAHHGFGAGKTLAAKLTKRQKVGNSFPDVKVVVLGHDHTKLAGLDQGIVDDDDNMNEIRKIKRYYLGSGSFLKTYVNEDADGSYGEEELMPPNDLGVVIMKIKLEKRRGRYRLDYHVSI